LPSVTSEPVFVSFSKSKEEKKYIIILKADLEIYEHLKELNEQLGNN